MRSKTIKRLAVLIAVLVLIGGTSFFVQRAQIKRLAKSVVDEAEIAEKKGDLVEAESRLRGHLQNVPNNLDVQFKYANLLLRMGKTPQRQEDALRIYNGILSRDPGNTDVRRRMMELLFEMGRYVSAQGLSAQGELLILLGSQPLENKDGDLQFRMGRCYEQAGDWANAEKYYQAAIKHKASQSLDAYVRRAFLFRNRLGQPDVADTVIQAMVESAPKNHKVYLERGRYRRGFGSRGAGDDFQKALELAPVKDKIEIYLEIAKLAEKEKGKDEARKILERELKTAPESVALKDELIKLELSISNYDRAIEILQSSLKASPNLTFHRWLLALVQAERGDNRGLQTQIEALKSIGFAPNLLRLLTAYYNINKHEYAIAKQLLLPLQSEFVGDVSLKSRVNKLLALCYNHLGDPELQREAYLRTLKDNPGDYAARRGWIAILINQGETDRAIEEYEKLVINVPEVRLDLAGLLIARNRVRPAVGRDWSKVDRLIADAAAESPDAVRPTIVQAESLLAQGRAEDAANLLEKARSKHPKSVEIWVAQIIVLSKSPARVEEARALLEKADQQLGDLVELRLTRAKFSATKKGPEVIAVLNKLAQNIDRFSKDDQQRLLTGLADEYIRQEDLQAANRLWLEVAQLVPNNIEPRRKLLNLAFMMANEEEIKKNIKEIERIEGSEGLIGKYCQERYLVFQAEQASKKSQQQAKQAKDAQSEADRLSYQKASEESQQRAQAFRTEAHLLINQLMSRRGDWSVIHLALAQLEEQELGLSQANLDEKQRQEKLERIINSYLRAIELGQRDSNTVRHAVQLLFLVGRGNEALELYSRSSVESQPGDDRAEQWAAKQALRNKDFRQAEQITRKALITNAGDFEEWLLLTQILLVGGNPDVAEIELRKAVELSKNDPVRWITLVKFLTETKQPEKAEKAYSEAQINLAQVAQPKAALALAECSELLGRAYEGGSNPDRVKKWYAEAKSLFEKAQAAQPNELSITRRLTQFFLQTRQINEAESQLRAILKRGARTDKPTVEVAWARRMLALTLIGKGDPEQSRTALALFEPTGQTGAATKAPETPEDQRVLARVLEAQKTPEYRKRAIEILNSLVGKNPDSFEDRLLLAQLNDYAGDWLTARQQYEELIKRTENREDPESRARRATGLDQFIKGLIRRGQAGESQELVKAQELVDKLKRLQPDELNPLVLEVAINRVQSQIENEVALKPDRSQVEKAAALKRAKNHLEKATAIIRAFADRPSLTPTMLGILADQAEALNELELAQNLLNQLVAKSPTTGGTVKLAEFLGRRGEVTKALDLCAPLWQTTREPELLNVVCFAIAFRPGNTVGPADLKRLIDWLTQALKQKPESTTLMGSLANLQERQGLYPQAEELYRRAIEHGDRNGNSYNNLAWLMALRDGGNLKDALEYVNRAIDLKGPKPDFLDTRGIVHLAAGENQLAITDLENAVAGDPSPSKYFHLAEAYLKANKLIEAKKNWEAANVKKGWEHGLHALEQPTFQKVSIELGKR